MKIQLTLEYQEFELHGSIYTWHFSINPLLVESVDAEPQTKMESYKVILRFLTAWGVGTPKP